MAVVPGRREAETPGKPAKRKTRLKGVLVRLAALGLLAGAWIVGSFRAEADVRPFFREVFPTADRFEAAAGGTYAAFQDGSELPLGYIGIGTAQGYGGDLKVVVAVSNEGRIIAATVASHRETASFFQRVGRKGLLAGLTGKSFEEDFEVGEDVDGITGATYTSRALADAVRRAGRQVADRALSLPVPGEPAPGVSFGWPEAVIIGLFVFGLFRRRLGPNWKKALRWVSLGAGLVLLGFVLNRPLNLVFINKILAGDWPAWQLNIYWYVLFGGVVLFVLTGKPSPYCEGFCPFGAAQECLGAIGGGRPPGRKLNTIMRWIQRGLAGGLVLAALVFRNPSLLNFEVSGTLFHLIGSAFQFGLLAAVLIASLFISRPWCRGLCPVRPVTDFLRWMKEGFSGSVTRVSDSPLD